MIFAAREIADLKLGETFTRLTEPDGHENIHIFKHDTVEVGIISFSSPCPGVATGVSISLKFSASRGQNEESLPVIHYIRCPADAARSL